MSVEWMEQNRELFEKIIKCGNIYANNHHKVVNLGINMDVSLSQIQVLEYVLEFENQKMSDVAKRLGVTKSALSQIAKRLEEKGWLEKYRCNNNKKEIFLKVTSQGKNVYNTYYKALNEFFFKDILDINKQIPKKYRDIIIKMFDIMADKLTNNLYKEEEKVYTKIE